MKILITKADIYNRVRNKYILSRDIYNIIEREETILFNNVSSKYNIDLYITDKKNGYFYATDVDIDIKLHLNEIRKYVIEFKNITIKNINKITFI